MKNRIVTLFVGSFFMFSVSGHLKGLEESFQCPSGFVCSLNGAPMIKAANAGITLTGLATKPLVKEK